MRPMIAVVLASCAVAAGCATHGRAVQPRIGYAADGAVSGEVLDAPSEQRYQVAPGSDYLPPVALRENARPVYPPALLDRRLPPARVVVRIVVDGEGRVASATLQDSDSDQPGFADAALEAVRGWTFVPLLRVAGDRTERLPFSQSYRFVFRQVNGRAIVEAGAPG